MFLGIQVDATERLFDLMGSNLGQVHVAAVGVGGVVDVCGQFANQLDDLQSWRLAMAGARQHQGYQSLIDQYGIGLIDKGHIGIGRDQVGDVGHQLIAQHVEADFVDRGVCDVAVIGCPAVLARRLRGDPADGQPHSLQQRAHPLRVAAGQVVVDGHYMYVSAGDGVPGRRDRARQGLTFTGGHLDHVAGEHP